MWGSHHFYCDKHKVRWHIGDNLFSLWEHETAEEQRANWEHIKDYKEVTPYIHPRRDSTEHPGDPF
jgi:hypothetical protein